MKELRVIIAGSRDFNDYELLKKSAIEIITKKTMLPDLTRIIIAGSRNFNDYEFLKREVLNIVKYDNRPKEYVKIISVCARGADTLGE